MTTIVENADSGSSATGMVIGILLAVVLAVAGVYFYNNGMTHTDVHTTNVFPAAPAAPSVNITTPAAPAAPAPEPAPAQ